MRSPLPILLSMIVSVGSYLMSNDAMAGGLELLITDRDNDAVYRFDGETGAFIDVFVPSGSGGLDRPVAVTIGPDDHLYISNFGPGSILKFNGETGAFMSTFYFDTFWLEEPVDVEFHDGEAFLLGNDTWNIVVVDAVTGAFKREFGNPTIRWPHDMLFGSDGLLYVATENTTSGLLQRWTVVPESLVDFFAPGGKLSLATGIEFMPDGDILVSDWWDDEVNRYDGSTFAFEGEFVSAASGGLNGPGKLKYGPDGNLYVANGNGVHRYDGETGAFMDVFIPTGATSGGLDNPRGFVFRSVGCGPEDLDGNGVIGAADLALLLGAWGPNPGDRADFDGNGIVNAADLAVLLGAWGPCS